MEISKYTQRNHMKFRKYFKLNDSENIKYQNLDEMYKAKFREKYKALNVYLYIRLEESLILKTEACVSKN